MVTLRPQMIALVVVPLLLFLSPLLPWLGLLRTAKRQAVLDCGSAPGGRSPGEQRPPGEHEGQRRV